MDESGGGKAEPRWHRALYRETDVSGLVFLRIALGVVLFWEVWRFFAEGDITHYWVEPDFHFQYPGFEWVRPLPGEGMYVLWVGLGTAAVCMALGFLYRLSALLFFLGYTYSFLIEQARYQNHYYLICLVSFLMIFVPAASAFSLDVKLGLRARRHSVPAWPRLLLMAQVGAVYFFGGVAKINADWLAGEPVRAWLAERGHYPVIGGLLETEAATWFVTYWGLLFDLALPFLLLSKRTRLPAFVLAVVFHMGNKMLFGIGIFPVLATAVTSVFFPPDWPRRVFASHWFERPAQARACRWPRGGAALAGPRAVLAFCAAYLGAQVFLPLRHWLYPGNVSWTEEGHKFAWHMKLRDKEARGELVVKDAGGRVRGRYEIRDFVLPWQADKAMTRPDMLLQVAKHVGRDMERKGLAGAKVFAEIEASLNGRPYQPLIDPEIDLREAQWGLGPSEWILPLTEPLKPRPGGRPSEARAR